MRLPVFSLRASSQQETGSLPCTGGRHMSHRHQKLLSKQKLGSFMSATLSLTSANADPRKGSMLLQQLRNKARALWDDYSWPFLSYGLGLRQGAQGSNSVSPCRINLGFRTYILQPFCVTGFAMANALKLGNSPEATRGEACSQ